jgi:outer membrane protein insertion porin family
VSESLVRANIRVKEGDIYNRAALDDDVRTLYGTGFFYNAQITEARSDKGVILIYKLQPKPRLTEIKFVGNQKYKATKLAKKISSKVGEPLDERKLFTDAEEIKTKIYQKAGMQATTVKYVIHPDEQAGRAAVTFEISEAPKVRIIDVYFEGATVFTQRKLRKEIKTRRHWMFSWLTGSGKLKEDQLEDDKEKLSEFYRNEGYIDFELKDLRYVYETPRRLVLHWVISAGRLSRVGAVDFKGVTLFSTNQALARLTMKVGDTFSPKGLSKDLEALQDLYGARGYIDAMILPRKRPNPLTGTMDLVYEVDEKGKSYIEKIQIRGNTRTKDRVLRRELAVAPGEVFDMVKVKLSKRRLENLHYFERVETTAEPTDVPDRRDLLVSVSERNTGNIAVGAGFSSIDSLLGFVEVTQGNFDLFNPPWFRGAGQKARLRIQIGTLRKDYEFTFIEPWFLGRKLALQVDLYHRELDYLSLNDLYSEVETGARLGLTKALGSEYLIGGVSYQVDDIGILEVPTNAPPTILNEQGYHVVTKFGTSLAYDTRNSVELPDKGQRTELRDELAGPFGGDTDFYRLELTSHWFFRGFVTNHVLELAGRIGTIESWGRSTNVHFFDRYFLGGLNSLRGYRYRDVGPREQGEPIGGDTSWAAMAEYSIPIIEFLRVAVFYDIGMVYPNAWSFSQAPGNKFYNDNWGVGLRLNIPHLGPLRLDYGIPITADKDNDSSGRFQFSVGYQRPW